MPIGRGGGGMLKYALPSVEQVGEWTGAESVRRLLHDLGTAIGVNKDVPQASPWDLAAVVPVGGRSVPMTKRVISQGKSGLADELRAFLASAMELPYTTERHKNVVGRWYEELDYEPFERFLTSWNQANKHSLAGKVDLARSEQSQAARALEAIKDRAVNVDPEWRYFAIENPDRSVGAMLSPDTQRRIRAMMDEKLFDESLQKAMGKGIDEDLLRKYYGPEGRSELRDWTPGFGEEQIF